MRLASGSAALAPAGKTITLTGDEQIQTRPIGPLLNSLNDLGAKCRSIKNNGKAPVEIGGALWRAAIPASNVSQVSIFRVCCYAASCTRDTTIDVTLLNEPDYVKMTCDWLDKQGISYLNRKYEAF